MEKLVFDRRFQLVVFAAAMVVIGAVIGWVVSTRTAEFSLGERVELATGAGASSNVALPITATEAGIAGWTDLGCFKGKGRYFEQVDTQGQAGPYLLVFNADDELIGVYLISRNAMIAPPWEYMPGGFIGVPDYEFEHWALPVFFKDPKLACGPAVRGGSGYSG